MDFNLDQALNEVFDTVRSGGVARGVKRLLAYCRKEDPDGKEWDKLEELPFEADAQLIVQFQRCQRFRNDGLAQRH